MLFAFPAIRKYQEKEVMTVASDTETGGFMAPFFTIIPTHGWKENMTFEKCLLREEDMIEECIETYAVNQSELIHDVVFGFAERRSFLRRGISVEGLAPLVSRAKYFTINMDDRITPDWQKDQIFFEFLHNNDFELYVHDPKFFAINWIHLTIPALHESILVNKTANRWYPIVMTEVEELNLPQDPCNGGEEYNFQNCVSESITQLLGCKPKWERSTGETSILKCNNASQFREYSRIKNELSKMEIEGIGKLTSCRKPCRYRE